MAVTATFTFKNRDLFEGLADHHRTKLRIFADLVSVQALSSMSKRLASTYAADGYRTGLLSASLTPNHAKNIRRFKQAPNASVLEVGSTVEYAAMQDRGGTIRPKTGKYLAIPLTAKLRRSLLWPRDLDPAREKLVLIKSTTGNLLLIDPTGELGFGKKPLYVLKPSVTIPAKRFTDHPVVFQEIDDAVPDLYDEFLELAT